MREWAPCSHLGRLDWQELRQLPPLSPGALALSALATGVSWFCYSSALQLGPVAGVAALDKLSFVLIALLALLWWLGVAIRACPPPSMGHA